ncbi:hypothetical protein RFM26_29230, partial [Mesorhizobium sp. VK23B]
RAVRDRLASKDCDMGTLLLLDDLGAPKDATPSPLAPYHLKHAFPEGGTNFLALDTGECYRYEFLELIARSKNQTKRTGPVF